MWIRVQVSGSKSQLCLLGKGTSICVPVSPSVKWLMWGLNTWMHVRGSFSTAKAEKSRHYFYCMHLHIEMRNPTTNGCMLGSDLTFFFPSVPPLLLWPVPVLKDGELDLALPMSHQCIMSLWVQETLVQIPAWLQTCWGALDRPLNLSELQFSQLEKGIIQIPGLAELLKGMGKVMHERHL